ncbi:conserved hypothetical protein [Burkholderia thailandensis E264]|uniref:Uncharacterized protein n=1 Tax=Burkholderia thailandensis (strain ATCC 700388 / DSM 13276 / CCUG 48851 / CIP 106301 / E264) TaxID=271848 RepID=Q2T1W4_BURTA|nr:conserved hypothetical protein [Burkholderia thailandensis E264]
MTSPIRTARASLPSTNRLRSACGHACLATAAPAFRPGALNAIRRSRRRASDDIRCDAHRMSRDVPTFRVAHYAIHLAPHVLRFALRASHFAFRISHFAFRTQRVTPATHLIHDHRLCSHCANMKNP